MYIHVYVCAFVHINRVSPFICKGKKKKTTCMGLRGGRSDAGGGTQRSFGTVSLGSILHPPEQGTEPSGLMVQFWAGGWGRNPPAAVVL